MAFDTGYRQAACFLYTGFKLQERGGVYEPSPQTAEPSCFGEMNPPRQNQKICEILDLQSESLFFEHSCDFFR